MSTDDPQIQKDKKLARWLRPVSRAANYIWIGALAFALPTLTIGTDFHDNAVAARKGVLIAIFLGPAYSRWADIVLAWHDRTGRDFEGWLFLPAVMAAALPGSVAAYIALRLLNHAGDWTETLAFSKDDALVASLMGVALAIATGYGTTIVRHYRRNENIFVRGGKRTTLPHALLLLFGLPVLMAVFLLVRAIF